MLRRHVSEPSAVVAGTVLAQRYRLDATIQNSNSIQGVLWRGVDIREGDTSVVLRQISDAATRQRFQKFWPELQSLSHPQLPRCGELFEADVSLWAVRYWQEGVTYRKLQQKRAERQLVFGAGEVLQLLLQLLPPLIALHAKGLVHGDINLSTLLRRHQDGLPVLLDFGLLQPQGTIPWGGVTSAYASIAQSSSETAEAWMDLHGLGVTALTLLTGRCPEELWNSDVQSWGWPESFEVDGSFRHVLERMLSEAPDQRFEKASDVICALQSLIMPESIGPKLIADRTLALAPQAVSLSDPPSCTSQSLLTEHRSVNQPLRRRAEEREQAAEGSLWSVVGALLASALVGTAIGWFLLSRSSQLGMEPARDRDLVGNLPVESPSAVEVDDRQQLLSRLRALQVKQSWFLQLVDASVLARFPHRGGRFPSDALDDVPLRQVWNDLAEEWLVRIEQLSPQLRRRLGELKNTDWQEQREGLSELGVHGRVIEQLVTAGAQKLLLGSFNDQKPSEPYLQFWYAAALRSLADVQIETLKARPSIPTVFSTRVSPGAARLISIQVPPGHRLVLEINGTPLMQMTVYGSQGDVIAERGSLRVVTLEREAGSPVQVLVTNEGLATALFTLSCRADQKASMSLPALDPNPLADSATGFLGRSEHPSRTSTLPRASAKENFLQPH
ncbi:MULTISPECIES: serine/threonine protein kinase [unclassified Prochlorococcus]|uniref:serine/threonine protein kinase n=1 Tax=unclassified Prochlorococcus TaxID=2627481 RepID=UPI0005337B99|nr:MULTISPECIES: serine/threonine protein kinase [unclassified Prochlorococcus]KGG30484.1 serine/threonine protein kinase [Prochlorococcus sp. MIT 0702]KGG33979.1 serine/threonine protein kinase [Prochlorococcus sp. MIT 0703]